MSLQRNVKTCVQVLTASLALLAGAMVAYAADDPAAGLTTVGCPDGCKGAAPATPCAGGCAASACCSKGGCCPCEKCPPPLVHCTPKPPKIKFKYVCPLPVCKPCDLQGYGYYPTCWRPSLPPPHCPDAAVPALNCGVPVPPTVLNLIHPQTEPVVPPQKGDEKGDGKASPQEKNADDMLPPTDH
jgi:hypothetical protein